MDIDIDMDAVAAAVTAALNTSQEKLTAILEKARKTLAVADDPNAPEPVRETAKKKAAEMLARYGLNAAMLADAGTITAKVDDDTFAVDAPYTYDKAALLATVVKAYGGQIVYSRKDVKRSTLRVFAMDSDLARFRLLWPSLMTQLTNEMAAAAKTRTGSERRDVFERWFIINFRDEVGQRIEAAEQQATDEAEQERVAEASPAGSGKSVALVLAGRQGQVEAAFKAAFPKVRKAPARRLTYSAEGAAAGREAGRRADLGASNKLTSSTGRGALR